METYFFIFYESLNVEKIWRSYSPDELFYNTSLVYAQEVKICSGSSQKVIYATTF